MRPAALAISRAAVGGSTSKARASSALTGRPRASATVMGWRVASRAEEREAVNPSPPSDTGMSVHATPGKTVRTPRAIAAAASPALIDSLKESGAITTLTVSLPAPEP